MASLKRASLSSFLGGGAAQSPKRKSDNSNEASKNDDKKDSTCHSDKKRVKRFNDDWLN